MPSKYDMAANEPATYAWGEAQDPEEEADWREQSRRVAAVVEAAIAWAEDPEKTTRSEVELVTAISGLLELEDET